MENDEICEVHNTNLVSMKVRISYGLPDFDKSCEVENMLFPNSKRYVLGGCLVDESFPRYSEELVCRECRKAESMWRKENNFDKR